MNVVFLLSFIGGLLLAVRVMLLGVERSRGPGGADEPSFRISPPIIVAFTIVFGASGYILSRIAAMPVTAALILAASFGILASVTAARLVTGWWKVTPEHDVDDERYVLQGQLARVVSAINAGDQGEIVYEVDGQERRARARSIGEVTVAADTEVVIERIEDDVVYVESWLEVEKRL